jgi:hypothetical protein
MANRTHIKVGDTIQARPGFGSDLPCKAVVVAIEVTKQPRTKYGVDVDSVDIKTILTNRAILTIKYQGSATENWIYAEQVVLF